MAPGSNADRRVTSTCRAPWARFKSRSADTFDKAKARKNSVDLGPTEFLISCRNRYERFALQTPNGVHGLLGCDCRFAKFILPFLRFDGDIAVVIIKFTQTLEFSFHIGDEAGNEWRYVVVGGMAKPSANHVFSGVESCSRTGGAYSREGSP